uniref:Uncharacterized protein n=1 Tax=uncultured marine virus TaxID=186617 RepID=A0A0F7L744_9VIRU|nr:hypothetical protein [uncultured marine virus]
MPRVFALVVVVLVVTVSGSEVKDLFHDDSPCVGNRLAWAFVRVVGSIAKPRNGHGVIGCFCVAENEVIDSDGVVAILRPPLFIQRGNDD